MNREYARQEGNRRLRAAKAAKNARDVALARLQEVRSAKMPKPIKDIKSETGKKVTPAGNKTAKTGKNPHQSAKKRYKIPQSTKKRARQNRKYSKLRKQYLVDHPNCEFQYPGCTQVATEVHHEEGREGERILEVDSYRSGCHHCHMIATEKSRQAIADGKSKSRMGKPRRGCQ